MTEAEPRTSGFRQALAITLTVWLAFVYGSYVVSELIGGRTNFLQDLPLDLPAVILVALVAQMLYPAALATSRWSAGSRWLALFLAATAVAVVQAAINIGENRLLGVIPALDAAHADLIRHRFGRMFLSHVYLSFANAALLVFLVENRRLAEETVRRVRSELLAARARDAALRLKLDPHFLFNTLNSISSLIVTRRGDDAEEMVGRLAEFLRLSLAADPGGLVTLEDEFATIEAYLAIEEVRFGDRMRVAFDLPTDLIDLAVPHFILQPLVENAIKYGVAHKPGTVNIRVAAHRDGEHTVLEVEDRADAPGNTPEGGLGIGTVNVRERLESHYGPGASLRLDPRPDGFVASILLPARDAVALAI